MIRQVGSTARGLALAVAAFSGIAPVASRGAGSEGEQIAELKQKLDQSLKMIEALTARVQQLEAAQPASTPTAAAAQGGCSYVGTEPGPGVKVIARY